MVSIVCLLGSNFSFFLVIHSCSNLAYIHSYVMTTAHSSATHQDFFSLYYIILPPLLYTPFSISSPVLYRPVVINLLFKLLLHRSICLLVIYPCSRILPYEVMIIYNLLFLFFITKTATRLTKTTVYIYYFNLSQFFGVGICGTYTCV